jgi:hypothetical protein
LLLCFSGVGINRDESRKCSSGAAKRHKKIYKEDILNTLDGSLEKFVVAKSAPYEEEGGEGNNLCFWENGYTAREANISAFCINTERISYNPANFSYLLDYKCYQDDGL